jgi:hypothetical protein
MSFKDHDIMNVLRLVVLSHSLKCSTDLGHLIKYDRLEEKMRALCPIPLNLIYDIRLQVNIWFCAIYLI